MSWIFLLLFGFLLLLVLFLWCCIPERMDRTFDWLFSRHPVEREVSNSATKLLNNMRVTSRCRYNASLRLKRKSNFSFFTTTFLSLGLILIPLVQNAGVKLALLPAVLNALQVFLAVAVLIYSVVIGTSQYEMRSKLLSNCADSLKDLTRNLRHKIEEQQASGVSIDLDKVHDKYREVCYSSESHKPVDYIFARLEMREDYCYTGLMRLKLNGVGWFLRAFPYTMPLFFILMEVLFVSDMFGYTSLLPSLFRDEGGAQ